MKISKNDLEVLNALQKNSRLSSGKIARKLRLSPQTVLNRMKFLEEKGIIKRYDCFINWRSLGFQVYELWVAAIPIDENNHIFENIQKMTDKESRIRYFKYVSGTEQYVFGIVAKNEKEVFKINEKVLLKLKERTEIKSVTTKEVISEYRTNKDMYSGFN